MNNDRGFLMMCRASRPVQTDADGIKNAVVRFNRSYGDRGYGIRLACGGNVHGVQIYNNAWVRTSGASAEPFEFVSNTESRPDVLTQQPLNWGNDLRVVNNTVTNLGGVQVRSSVFAEKPAENSYSAARNVYDGPGGTLTEHTVAVNPTPNTTIHPVGFFDPSATPLTLCGTAADAASVWAEKPAATSVWRTCTDTDTGTVGGVPLPVADWGVPAPSDAFSVPVNPAAPLVGIDQALFQSTTPGVVAGPRPTFTGSGYPGIRARR